MFFIVFYFLHGLSAPCVLYIMDNRKSFYYPCLHLLHKFCVKGKSLYFTRRFEFPECAKLVGSTITFFSVFLLFYLKDDLTSLIEDPVV